MEGITGNQILISAIVIVTINLIRGDRWMDELNVHMLFGFG